MITTERTKQIRQTMIALIGYDNPFLVDNMADLPIWRGDDRDVVRSICETQCLLLSDQEAMFVS